jgi:uncharacterized protein
MMGKLFAAVFDFWHGFVSPWLPRACRFEPTCSQYGAQAFRQHGFFRGGWLALKRLAKCGPWHEGGHDPVP